MPTLPVPSLATLALSRASILALVRQMTENQLLAFVLRADPDMLRTLHREFGHGLADCDCPIRYNPCPCGDADCEGRCDHPHRDIRELIQPCHHARYTGYILPPAVADAIPPLLALEEYAEPPMPEYDPEEATVTQRSAKVGVMIVRAARGRALRHPWDEQEGAEDEFERLGTRCPECHEAATIEDDPTVPVQDQDAECPVCHWCGLVRELDNRLRNGADAKESKLALKRSGPARVVEREAA